MQWSEEQLEISSPGGFPSGIRLDNLLVAPPRPRSPLLADAFKRTGLVEPTGRGSTGCSQSSFGSAGRHLTTGEAPTPMLSLSFPAGPANLSMTRWVLEQENQQGLPLRLAELQMLAELVRERRATTKCLTCVPNWPFCVVQLWLTCRLPQPGVRGRGPGLSG